MPKKTGALPDFMIHELIKNGSIKGASEKHVGPASLDLSISSEVYRTEDLFLPYHGEKIRDLIKSLGIGVRFYDLRQPLERGVTYIARLNETLDLPKGVYGYCNPKSSVGRNDVHVRVLADGVARYDAVTPAGFKGELWLAITPNSFPAILPEGEKLTQLRLFNSDTRFDETELQIAFRSHNLISGFDGKPLSYEDMKISDGDGSVLLTLNLVKCCDGAIGYECRGSKHPLDFGKGKAAYKSEVFFQPIVPNGDIVHLESGKFYIFSTKESINLPADYAAEVVSMDDRSGEFRSHYAGFIDPGFDGRLVLEVRPYHDIAFRDGQPICKIKFERMIAVPDLAYGAKADKNYQHQSGAKLSKHFE